MKNKSFFFVATFFVLSFSAQAQWSFGIQISKSKAWHKDYFYYSNSGRNNQPLPTVNGVGMTTHLYYKFNKHFQVGVEPGIAQRGTASFAGGQFIDDLILMPSSSFFAPVNQYAFYTTFFQMPFMARVQAPIAQSKFSFFIKGGIGPSWLASAERKLITPTGGSSRYTEKVDLKEADTKRWDLGMYSGVGLQLKIKQGQLQVGLDQYLGFNSFYYYFDQSKSRSYGLTLGYHHEL